MRKRILSSPAYVDLAYPSSFLRDIKHDKALSYVTVALVHLACKLGGGGHLRSDREFATANHKVRKECGRQETSEVIKNGCRQDWEHCPCNEIDAWSRTDICRLDTRCTTQDTVVFTISPLPVDCAKHTPQSETRRIVTCSGS